MAEPALMPVEQEIPDKLYFRIGEVSRIAGVKPYVLRFWESQFPGLGPKKTGKGQRLFRRKDVEMVLEIKHLLYDKRYTIEGARKWLDGRAKPEKKAPPLAQAELFHGLPPGLDNIRRELRSILKLLK